MSEISKRNNLPEVFLTLDPRAVQLAIFISVYRTHVSKDFILDFCEEVEGLQESDYDSTTDSLLQSELIDATDEGFMIAELYLPFLKELLKNMVDQEPLQIDNLETKLLS